MRKYSLVFGILLGFIGACTYLWLASFYPDLVPFNPYTYGLAGKQSLKVGREQMCVITAYQGKAVIDFTYFDSGDSAPTEYRWRYKSHFRDNEEAGTGVVFEKYKKTPTEEYPTLVENAGGELFIKAGPIRVEWSAGSRIYYDPDTMKTKLLPENQFDSYRF